MLGFQLSPEQVAIRDKAREFMLKEILPVAWRSDAQNETPLPLLRKAWEQGIMNADIPAEYGGQGRGLVDNVLITEELAAGCAGLATSIFDNSLGMEPLRLCANPALKAKIFPRLVREPTFICFATSEPTMGSDVAGIRCRATPDGDDYVLNGTKYWITNGGVADYMSVFATVDPALRHEGICAFLVEKEWPGVSIGRRIPKLGQRGSETVGHPARDNVRVPRENVLAPPGEGVRARHEDLRPDPAGDRRLCRGGGPLGDGVRHRLRPAAAGLRDRASGSSRPSSTRSQTCSRRSKRPACWSGKRHGRRTRGSGPDGLRPRSQSSTASEVAVEIADEALQIFGGYGYTRLFPIEKILRDCRLFRIYEGTSEIQRQILAGHAMKAYRPVMPPLEELPIGTPGEAEGPEAGGKAWRCRMCGHVHYGDEPPEECPYCFYPKTAFKPVG